MKITKYGHCTLLIELNGTKILTDPGIFSDESFLDVKEIDAIVITHEHQDHFHIESIKKIIEKNPSVEIFSNHSVGKLLREQGISFVPVGGGEVASLKGVMIEGFGKDHAEIYEIVGLVENTGFIIGDLLYYPGDSFYLPEKRVPILAVPIYGPWMKISDAIKFVQDFSPLYVIPVHDAPLAETGFEISERHLKNFLPENAKFIRLRNVGDSHKFEIN